jgi:DivIVA domain-containing protein
MDLTPQLFRDVEFTERRGAYDRDEVNAFLARVGTAVGQLQERVREAQRRVEAAEERSSRLEAKSREQEDANETMQRMIETAARFADEAMREAKEESEEIVAGARKKADEMIMQAEEAIRRDVGATRDRLEAEIRQLERHRDALTERVALVESHLGRERVRLRSQLEELLTAVDDPDRLTMVPPPGDDPEPVIVLTEGPQAASRVEPVAEDPMVVADDDEEEDLSDLPPPPEDWEPASALQNVQDEPAEVPDEASPALFDRRPASDRSSDPDPDLDGGPPTEAHPVVGPGSAFGGNHLDQLRRAVSDEPTDAEADAAMAAFFDQDTDDEPSRRFGRRR